MTTAVPITTTGRERELIERLADGYSTRAIAEGLSVSERTVKSMIATLCLRWALNNRSHLVAFALRRGVIT